MPVSGKILGTIAQNPSVSTSNLLNFDIFQFSSIKLRNTSSSELISDLSKV